MKLIFLTIVFSIAMSLQAEKFPIERYRSVIDRQMFGDLPPDFDPTKLPSEVKRSSAGAAELSQEQEQLMKAVHFSAINVSADGEIEVGFSDLTDNSMPEHYFLKVGESSGGWKVESADAEKATVTLVKDGIVLDLSLGDKSAQAAGKVATTEETSRAVPVAMPMTFRQRRNLRLQESRARDDDMRKSLAALREDLRLARQEIAERREKTEEESLQENPVNTNEQKAQIAAEGTVNEKDETH
jgi:hypothetical protein